MGCIPIGPIAGFPAMPIEPITLRDTLRTPLRLAGDNHHCAGNVRDGRAH